MEDFRIMKGLVIAFRVGPDNVARLKLLKEILDAEKEAFPQLNRKEGQF